MSKAVVTGGAGFIGSHITELLLHRGLDVYVFDDLSTGKRSYLDPRAHFVEGSICDVGAVCKVLEGAEYVFHAAALARIQPSFDDPIGHDEVNVTGTLNCLLATKGNKRLKKFVISSSSTCYGTPTELPTPETARIDCLSPYALQKYAAEQYTLILGERFGLPVVALRYFNVYGPRSFNPENPYNAYTSVVGIFAHQKQQDRPLTITGDGSQWRDFVHVRDVARANLVAALAERTGQAYNVGCGVRITIRALAELFDHPLEYVPERKGEARITWADIRKIQTELGWTPEIDLQKGLRLSKPA